MNHILHPSCSVYHLQSATTTMDYELILQIVLAIAIAIIGYIVAFNKVCFVDPVNPIFITICSFDKPISPRHYIQPLHPHYNLISLTSLTLA